MSKTKKSKTFIKIMLEQYLKIVWKCNLSLVKRKKKLVDMILSNLMPQ